MSWLEAQLTRAAFRLFFRRDSPCFITRVSEDIWLDHIFPHFLVEHLIQLRLTNKAFYLLTHEPVIWKRYLQRMQIPVAQLRPTFQYSEKVANYEIETLVTSACALDRSWRSGLPQIRSENILVTRNKVVDLKLLPGGKFLVASVKDRSNFRCFIHVYAMDVMHGSRLLARLPTFHKVFNLQAKYMKYNGNHGIMISYIRRRFKHGVPAGMRDDINDFYHNTPIDTHHPLIYEACCVHMRLDPVEILIRPDVQPTQSGMYTRIARDMPPPFQDILRYETEFEIHSPTIFEHEGEPFMAFVEDVDQGSLVQVIQLPDRVMASLSCGDYPGHDGVPHRIRALRYLPCQGGIFVVRSVSSAPGTNDAMVFETYDFPSSSGLHHVEALNGWECADKWKLQGEVVVSDHEPREKMAPDHPTILTEEDCPPTIWVFAPSEEPKGCAFWWFRAHKDHMGKWKYTETSQQVNFHQNDRFHERALPGSERTLFLELDKGISESSLLSKMRRFLWPSERFPKRYLTSEISVPVTERPAEHRVAIQDIMRSEKVIDTVNQLGGLIAITWDENSGKICLAAEREDQIRVYDMAPIAEPHLKKAYQWRQRLISPDPLP